MIRVKGLSFGDPLLGINAGGGGGGEDGKIILSMGLYSMWIRFCCIG